MNGPCERCEHCPVAPGVPCARFCADAATGDPAVLRHIIGRSAFLSGDAPAPQHAARLEQSPRPAPAQVAANIARMKACPHWEASSACGCGNNICRIGKGRAGVVSHADCFTCLDSADAVANPGDQFKKSESDP